MSSMIINKPKGLSEKTERATFSKYDTKQKSKLQEVAYFNLQDYERLRKNAIVLSDQEIRNQ